MQGEPNGIRESERVLTWNSLSGPRSPSLYTDLSPTAIIAGAPGPWPSRVSVERRIEEDTRSHFYSHHIPVHVDNTCGIMRFDYIRGFGMW
jgi:hypothetical protein